MIATIDRIIENLTLTAEDHGLDLRVELWGAESAEVVIARDYRAVAVIAIARDGDSWAIDLRTGPTFPEGHPVRRKTLAHVNRQLDHFIKIL